MIFSYINTQSIQNQYIYNLDYIYFFIIIMKQYQQKQLCKTRKSLRYSNQNHSATYKSHNQTEFLSSINTNQIEESQQNHIQKIQFSSQKYISQYQQFFKGYKFDQSELKKLIKTSQPQSYKITIQSSCIHNNQVIFIKKSQDFKFSYYEVFISCFKVQIIAFNHQGSVTFRKDFSLGNGSFGRVSRIKYKYQISAQKRIELNKEIEEQRRDLNDCIKQFALYKIAAMLKIGPETFSFDGIDIHTYENCVDFYMQCCQTFQNLSKQYTLSAIKKQLKENLFKLHRYRIIHKDIKIQNILYSPIHKKFVLSDFGLSHFIKQSFPEQKYYAYKSHQQIQGTPANYYPQLQNAYFGKKTEGFFNFYYNDLFGLRKIFQVLPKKIKQLMQKIKKNQLDSKKDNDIKYTQIQFDYEQQVIRKTKSKYLIEIRAQGFNFQIDKRLKNQLNINDQKYQKLKYLKGNPKYYYGQKFYKINSYLIQRGYHDEGIKNLQNREIQLNDQKFNYKGKKLQNQIRLYNLRCKDQELVSIYCKKMSMEKRIDICQIYLQKMKCICQNYDKKQKVWTEFESCDLMMRLKQKQYGIIQKIKEFLHKNNKKQLFYQKIKTFAHLFKSQYQAELGQQLYQYFDKKIKKRLEKSKQNKENKEFQQMIQFQVQKAAIYNSTKKYYKCIQTLNQYSDLLIKYDNKHQQLYSKLIAFINNIRIFALYSLYKYESAYPLSLKNLEIYKKVFGLNSNYVAKQLNNLGLMDHHKGNYSLALKYRQQSFKIRSQALKKDHVQNQIGLNSLSLTNFSRGDLTQAIKYQQQRKRILFTNNLEISKQICECYCQLLQIYTLLENQDKIKLYQEYLSDVQKKLEKNDLKYSYYKIMGILSLYKQSFEKSQQYFNKCFEINLDHIQKLHIHVSLLELYNQMQNQTKLSEYLKKIKILLKHNYQKSMQFTKYYLFQSQMLLYESKYEEAQFQLNKCIQNLKQYHKRHILLLNCYIQACKIYKLYVPFKNENYLKHLKQEVDQIACYYKLNKAHSKIVQFNKLYSQIISANNNS